VELSDYAVSPLRQGDLTVCRGFGDGLTPILLVTARDGLPASLKRLEHEYGLKADLDGAWAARPVELSGHNNRMTLVLEDPGGEPLDRLIGRPLAVSDVLRIAIPLATALRGVPDRGLVHTSIKPASLLAHLPARGVWLTGFGIGGALLPSGNLPLYGSVFVYPSLAGSSGGGKANRSLAVVEEREQSVGDGFVVVVGTEGFGGGGEALIAAHPLKEALRGRRELANQAMRSEHVHTVPNPEHEGRSKNKHR